MELEVHFDRIRQATESIVGDHENMVSSVIEHPKLGPFHPRVIRAEAILTKSLARGFFELGRMTPHAYELYKMCKEQKDI